MGIFSELNNEETWKQFYSQKMDKGYWTAKEEKEWETFIEQESYKDITIGLLEGTFPMTIPEKRLVNKFGSNKKRIVYTYTEPENKVLKVLAWLLYRYDDVQASNCYSFRKNMGAKKAIQSILRVKNLTNMYYYKVDIKDYFNSIQVDTLLSTLKVILEKDKLLYTFFERLLRSEFTLYNGEVIKESRGAMAGTPTAAFFANIYLMEMDKFFEKLSIPYARYSDDIIVFGNTREEIEQYKMIINDFLKNKKLLINYDKEFIGNSKNGWEFLGIFYKDGQIDLSSASKNKMKGKIKRKARALYRWKLRKQASTEDTIRAMNKVFNKKFYDNPRHDELTWTKWFFPLLTVEDGLREIDQYMQENLRYLGDGRYHKKNYKITYKLLKDYGYKSLVHEFFLYKEGLFRKNNTYV